MATRVFDEIKFCEQTTSQGTFLQSFVQTGPAVWEEMFTELLTMRHKWMTDTGPP